MKLAVKQPLINIKTLKKIQEDKLGVTEIGNPSLANIKILFMKHKFSQDYYAKELQVIYKN